MRSRFVLGVFASFAFLLACEKQPDTIPVTGITLEPTSVELVDGEIVTIAATISPVDATNKQVKWTSSSPSILVSDGRITTSFKQGAPTTLINGKPALGQGTVTATTEDGGKMAKCQVIVYAKVIAVTGIRLSESSLQLAKGESRPFLLPFSRSTPLSMPFNGPLPTTQSPVSIKKVLLLLSLSVKQR